jgi:uncharacterized protein (DUF488 family)
MLWREKILLETLNCAPNKKATKIQLLKWLFLLREEERIGDLGVFYDFLPYKFGPFSFTVYNDLDRLQQLGLLGLDDTTISFIEENVSTSDSPISSFIQDKVCNIILKYGSIPPKEILAYVYKKYPWYASKSEILEHKPRRENHNSKKVIYSIGYEGLSIDAFLNKLMIKRIGNLVDVRNNPASRKFGFSSSYLKKRCADIEINYFHFPELGVPSAVRHSSSDKKFIWSYYKQGVLSDEKEAIQKVSAICNESPTVLLCFEEKPEDCHRHLLAKHLNTITGLPVIHL